VHQYRADGGEWVDHGTKTSYTWCGYKEGDHTSRLGPKTTKDSLLNR
jgi:hypothetical protein